ncbi:nuclear pore membrane glycoprotein 210-like [Stigmatopora nigra]
MPPKEKLMLWLYLLFFSQTIYIDSVFPEEYVEVLNSSLIKSHNIVKAKRNDSIVFYATLAAFEDDNNGEPLTNPVYDEQDIESFSPIVLTPSNLTFPWQPKVEPHEYIIKASGGSGNFSWSSSNTSVATVTDKGVMTTASDIGVSIIHAHDMHSPLYFGEMMVYVVEPVAMVFAPCQVEARVGTTLELPLRMFGRLGNRMEQVLLSDCSHFDLQVNELLEDRLAPGHGYCSGVRAKALAPGYTTLSVSYIQGSIHLSAKIIIAAYPPLIAIDPVSVAVVTLGSSKDMLFEGGPLPWVAEPSKTLWDFKAENEESISLTLISPSSRNYDQHFVRAACRTLGEQMLEVIVSNKASVSNLYPAVERVSVKFVCTPPRRLTLVPLYTIPKLNLPCPFLQPKRNVMPVSNHRNSVLVLAAFDQQGRKFDNFSSLSILWKSSNVSLASFEPTLPMTLQLFEDENKQMKVHGQKTIVVHQQSGNALITATVQDNQFSRIKAAKVIRRNEEFSPVSVTLELILIEDVNILPDTLTIYNHPDVRVTLSLKEGSGFFFVNTSVKDIVNVVLEDTKREAQIVPVQAGVVQVMVHELCLALPSIAKATVHISDILEVNLRVVDKLEIDKYVICYASVLADNKKPFPVSYFQFMKLKLKAASSIVSIMPIPDQTEHSAVFKIKGVSVGQTTLSAVVVDKKGRTFSSAPQQIEVFLPFQLMPRKMTLLIGAMMQITVDGAPQPHSNILFSIANEAIASVNGIGQVKALSIGNVRVTGFIQAVDTETGKLVVVWEDQIEVEVVRLTAIRIRGPITCIKKGAQMPVYVMGLTNSQTPFTFANAVPQLSFHWSTTKTDIVDVQSRHSMANVELNSEHNFSMRVIGQNRGRTGLTVVVKVDDANAGQLAGHLTELKDEIQIEVFDNLHILSPTLETGEILMAPNSVLQLQTRRDGTSVFSYKIMDGIDQAAVVQVDQNGLVFSGPHTGISSLLVHSQEFIGVNQTLIITIKVLPVYYVRFTTSTVLHTFSKESLKALPLGIVLTFTIHFHAITGEALHSSNNHLNFSTNRNDLVQIEFGPENHVLTVRTVKAGLTLLSVHDRENTEVADYIPLPVEHTIQPEEPKKLVVGDVICFTAQLAAQDGHGSWTSSANNVLQVDSKTGAAVARDYGTATVYYEIPGVLKTYREVNVESATKTSAIAESLPVRFGKQTKVQLTTRKQGTNLIGVCSSIQKETIAQMQPETSVICQLSFTSHAVNFPASSVFKTHTSFDPNIGLYTCYMTLQPMADQITRVLSLSMTNLLVTANLDGSAFFGEQVSARLPIEPGLYSDLTELMLTNLHPSAEFTVFGPAAGLADMEVVSTSPDIDIQIIEAVSGFAPHSKYTIKSLDLRAAVSTSITISSASLSQSFIIPVTFRHLAEPGASRQVPAAPLNTGEDPAHVDINLKMQFILFAILAFTSIIYIVVSLVFPPIQPNLRTLPPNAVVRLVFPPLEPSHPSTFSLWKHPPFIDSRMIPDRGRKVHLWSVDY